MASRGSSKGTTGIMMMTMALMRVVVVLWLCSGCCVCDDEFPSPNFGPQSRTQEVPVAEAPAGTETAVSLEDDAGADPSPVEEDGTWADRVSPGGGQSDAGESDQQQSESVQDQSEAPQEEEGDNSPTDITSVETKTTSGSSENTAEPTDQPEELGDYILRNDEGVICLRACFAALLKVNYIGEDDEGKAVNRTAEIPVSEKADVGGRCGRGPSGQAVLYLKWDGGKYSLKITFQKQNATAKGDPDVWEAARIQFSFDTGDYNYFDAAINASQRTVHTSKGSTYFVTPQGNSRVCDAEDDITMLPTANRTDVVTMEISQLKMQPYGLLNGTFSEGVDCGKDLIENPNTNVASVAVGATLACLILIVIIVYAVGRKMGAINDRTGYKSVE